MTHTTDTPHVVLAGAGIGGLAAALRLHEAGIETTVLESVREPRPLGVGINLQPQAVGVLFELGLADRLDEVGVRTRELVYRNEAGATVHEEPTGLAGGFEYPQYSVHRGELQLMLLDAVRERLGPRAVTTGTRVEGFAQDATGVVVATPGGELRADVLVGADGIHSTVRRRLVDGPDPLRWSGQQMWRGAAERPALDDAPMTVALGPSGSTLVLYPIGRSVMNWAIIVPVAAPGSLPKDASWNAPGAAEDVLGHLGGWDLPDLDVTGIVVDSPRILEYPLVDREPLASWGSGRVTLLGDAAHPMYPFGANGGSQAIVDADALAHELRPDATTDVADALAAYERIRRPETTAAVEAARTLEERLARRDDEEVAAVSETYRRQTHADRQPANA